MVSFYGVWSHLSRGLATQNRAYGELLWCAVHLFRGLATRNRAYGELLQGLVLHSSGIHQSKPTEISTVLLVLSANR
jgi:hypothetical protein